MARYLSAAHEIMNVQVFNWFLTSFDSVGISLMPKNPEHCQKLGKNL